MSSPRPDETTPAVLVVGAGPAGLLLSCELLRRGVPVRVVEKRDRADSTTRALSLWGKATDILVGCGVDRAEIEARSVPIRRLTYFDRHRHLASFRLPEGATCRTLPQQETEGLLADRVRALGGVIERSTSFEAIEADTDRGVTVRLRGPGGAVERVEAQYLVGADGARSAVRKALGVGFAGDTFERSFAVVDAHAQGHLPPDECLFYQTPQGPLVVVPIGDGVFRFLTMIPEGTSDRAFMQHVVDSRGPAGVRLGDVVSEAVFRVHAREAEAYRTGRTFLVGDAAHVHSPAGGQGMNNGLHDAHNLGWKLAAVTRGRAPASLLDTYEPERRHATRRIIDDTNRQTSLWMLKSRVGVAARNAAFRTGDRTGLAGRWYAPVMAGYRTHYPCVRDSQLPGSRLGCRSGAQMVGRSLAGPGDAVTGSGDSWTLWVHDADDALTCRLRATAADSPLPLEVRSHRRSPSPHRCGRAGYLLVRPDGYVQAHGHAGDLGRLRAELVA